jgi:DNA helicase-2/ATP-dependent DNA helicase PcrA
MDWMDLQAAEAPAGDASDASEATRRLVEGLNTPQKEAVLHGAGALLILAGPGSGKTRVITRRIANLLLSGQARPHEILAITFTNKAAREMRERVEALVPVPGLWISTFHAMGARILRREIEMLAGPWTRDFSIYDTHDRNQLLRRLIAEAGYDSARFRPAMVGSWISSEKNRTQFSVADAGDGGIEAEALEKISKAYNAALAKANALDFDDLLLKVLELFEAQPGVRDSYASRFRWVLIDEFQDTNGVQYELARHLSGWHGNLAVCGDPDQSIYAWRGADIRNIVDFESDYPGAKVVLLEQNYRSTRHILESAQAVISCNRSRKQKRTWSDGEAGEKLCVIECGDEDDEAREIAAQISGWRARGGRLSDVAVFYRANFLQRALEAGLRRAALPYRIVAGVEFYERREIRDLLAWLKLAVNASDDVAFLRVVNTPARGIGEKSLGEIARWAADRRLPLIQAARSKEALSLVRGKARSGLEAFAGFVARCERLADGPAAAAIDAILAEIDVGAWLGEMDDESLVDREANLEELRAHAQHWDEGQGSAGEDPDGGAAKARSLRTFLQEIALVSETDGGTEASERVTLMTLHAAKGLEFSLVLIAGCEEELLPHSRALSEARGADPDAGLEEERRLFYVGMTRAKQRLLLTWARQRLHFGSMSFRQPSRFLEEIPEEHIESSGAEPEPQDPFIEYEAEEEPLQPGALVQHEHFGRGTVLRIQGSGVNARATVRFVTHGERQLLLAYAKLTIVGRGA